LTIPNYIKTDNKLRLEVRTKGEAFVYYRKGKALEIGKLKVDKMYGNTPDTKLAVSNPPEYFKQIKKSIDSWLEKEKNRGEFDTEQNVAQRNQTTRDRYIVLDMEYAFEQNRIRKENREKKSVFDLLGIERASNKIIFFEIKRGMGAIRGNSGIEDHIADFNTFIYGKNSTIFRANLINDIKNIVADKLELGIIKNFSLPENLEKSDIELVFVFDPDEESEISAFAKELNKRHELIIVGNGNYELK